MDIQPARPSRKRKRLIGLLSILLLLATAANVLVYLTRSKMDMFVPATYKTLYHPTDVPTLAGTEIVGRGRLMLKIVMKDQPRRWVITDDAGGRYEQAGAYPVLKLLDFQHGYEIAAPDAVPPSRISIHFGFYSSEFYKKAGRTQPDNYWLISADIPMGKFRQYPLSHWVDTFPYIGEDQKAEARRIIRDEMGISGSETTLEKIDKVCAYQINRLQKHLGTPNDRIEAEVSPFRIFQWVCADEGKIWCTQNAMIYHFFANMAGIPTRLITLNGHIDKVITTGHSFAESFVIEQGTWARIDTQANKFYVWNRENRLLNSADILHEALIGSFDGLSAKTFRDGQVVTVPYSEVNASDLQMFSPGAHLIYRRGSYKADRKILRYFCEPNLAYSLDADYAKSVYMGRRSLIAVWVALLLGLAGALIFRRRD
jgi:hypothetical protein